jgi:hypothetical protein
MRLEEFNMLKKIIIPLILLVTLIIIAVVLKGPWAKSPYSPATPKKVITNFEPDQVSRIELSQKDKEVILGREQNKWLVVSSFNYPANQEKVSELLSKVKNLKQSDIASRNIEKHAIFQVDAEQGRLLKIFDAKEGTLSDVYIGKTAADYQSTYLRLRNSDEVLIVDEDIGRLVPVDAKSWLERTLFKFDSKEITQITLKSITITKTEEIILVQDEKQEWTITAPEKHPCDKAIATDLAQTLSSIELEDVASSNDLATYNLDQPQQTIIVQRKDNPSYTLLIGKTNEAGDYYVKTDTSNFVVIVRKSVIKKTEKKFEDFIDRTLTQIDRENITELTLTYPEMEMVIKKNESGEWLLERPISTTAQKDTVDFIINTFSNLKANSATTEKDLETLELTKPLFKVSAKLQDSSTPTLLIGKKKDDQMHYVKKGDLDTVYLLSKHYVETMMKKLEDLKSPPQESPPPEKPQEPDKTLPH